MSKTGKGKKPTRRRAFAKDEAARKGSLRGGDAAEERLGALPAVFDTRTPRQGPRATRSVADMESRMTEEGSPAPSVTKGTHVGGRSSGVPEDQVVVMPTPIPDPPVDVEAAHRDHDATEAWEPR